MLISVLIIEDKFSKSFAKHGIIMFINSERSM